jgi:hypothetical protein
MRYFIGILLVLGAFWGVRQLLSHWETVKAKSDAEDGRAPVVQKAAPETLPGLPPGLEASLQNARKQGASGLRNWLKLYRSYVSDPRLASIELDYVILAGPGNLKEAKQFFTAVKQRTPTNSPVYPRIKQLEKTYQ